MSALADSLAEQMGGAQVGGVRAALSELRQRYGSVTAAAKAAGVDRRTWQRIESGKTHHPRPSTADRVTSAVLRTRSERANLAERGVKVQFSYDGRLRDLTFGGASHLSLRPGTVEAMGNAFSGGDREGAAQAFVAGVVDPWYQEQFEEAYEGSDSDYSPEFV